MCRTRHAPTLLPIINIQYPITNDQYPLRFLLFHLLRLGDVSDGKWRMENGERKTEDVSPQRSDEHRENQEQMRVLPVTRLFQLIAHCFSSLRSSLLCGEWFLLLQIPLSRTG
jgi:hypothetical protein